MDFVPAAILCRGGNRVNVTGPVKSSPRFAPLSAFDAASLG